MEIMAYMQIGKVMLKTKAILKTMEKLFATTMAIFVFLLAESQNPNSILYTTSYQNCKSASQHIYLFNKHYSINTNSLFIYLLGI